MKILIAPDKFKGSLSAAEAAEAIRKGLSKLDAGLKCLPIADGGEGTAAAVCEALGGDWVECEAHDALGRPVTAAYAIVNGTAVMEMSQASGVWRLKDEERDPLRASTFGTGEMIADAVGRGVKRIVLGIGGSATNDGGSGMARALGFRFVGAQGAVIEELPEKLLEVNRIDKTRAPELPEVLTACDVANPLLGEHGATRVYGAQKGVSENDIEFHERRLRHLADLVERDLGVEAREKPGAGAAGGLGFGCLAFCGAELKSGFEVVAELLNLEEAVKRADLVVTGEGSLDEQTLHGKGPHGVAQMAKKFGKPVLALAGKVSGQEALAEAFDRVVSIRPDGVSVEESMREAKRFVTEAAQRQTAWIRGQIRG